MAKKITEKIVESCKHCPNCWTEIHGEDTYVRCGKNSKLYDDFDSIPPDCPLEDESEKSLLETHLIPEMTRQELADRLLEYEAKIIRLKKKLEDATPDKLADEAIGFGEYIRINGWRNRGDKWSKESTVSIKIRTTEELYKEYKK